MEDDLGQSRRQGADKFEEVGPLLLIRFPFGHTSEEIEFGEGIIIQELNHFIIDRVPCFFEKIGYPGIRQVDCIGWDIIFCGNFKEGFCKSG